MIVKSFLLGGWYVEVLIAPVLIEITFGIEIRAAQIAANRFAAERFPGPFMPAADDRTARDVGLLCSFEEPRPSCTKFILQSSNLHVRKLTPQQHSHTFVRSRVSVWQGQVFLCSVHPAWVGAGGRFQHSPDFNYL